MIFDRFKKQASPFLIASVAMVLTIACGPEKEDEITIEAPFEGVTSIILNSDGTWTLNWPVASSSTARYLIYRAKKGEAFDYSKPYFSTLDTAYTTEVLLFQPPLCFNVRVSTDNLVSDDNTKFVCTEESTSSSTGFNAIADPNENNGRVVLTWPSINLPGARYTVYERFKKRGGVDVTEDFDEPITTTANTLFDAGVTNRGDIRCFQLKVDLDLQIEDEIPDDAASANDKELCTDEYYEEPLVFTGIDSVQMAYCDTPSTIEATGRDSVLVPSESNLTNCIHYQRETWTEPPTTGFSGLILDWNAANVSADVVGFDIYLGSGFETNVTCVIPSSSSEDIKSRFADCKVLTPDENGKLSFAVLNSITPDTTYHLGVKAFDIYGRHDKNIKTVPIEARALDAEY